LLVILLNTIKIVNRITMYTCHCSIDVMYCTMMWSFIYCDNMVWYLIVSELGLRMRGDWD